MHQSVKELLECAKCAKTLILSRTDTIPFPIYEYKENKSNLSTQILKLPSLQIISPNTNLLFVIWRLEKCIKNMSIDIHS